MTRKSKQAGGNFPLTHYERTKKFASKEGHGTTSKRIAGHSQYQLGDCGLNLTKLDDEGAALCTPSGYLYSEDAILSYLLSKTQEIKEQREAYEQQQRREDAAAAGEGDVAASKKRAASVVEAFEESQRTIKKRKSVDRKQAALDELKKTSYWLADAQPDRVERRMEGPPPDRPPSPHTGQPLRRKDLWPVRLAFDGGKLACAISGKVIGSSEATAYWTDKKPSSGDSGDGTIALTSVYEDLVSPEDKRCPNTSKKIRHVRKLQRSGTSFATSGQQVQVQTYAPTIT